MATNLPYMSRSPYPTGRSPFAVDLSENMAAITQQMVENRQKEIKDYKLQVEENEGTLLKALDFKTVEGIQDKAALDHATRIKELSDKWAIRMKERQGILSTNDKLELLKDKRDVEGRLAKAAADVATIKKIQEDLAKEKGFVYQKNPTAKKLVDYIDKGLIGEGNAINIPEVNVPVFGYETIQRFEPFMVNRAKDFIEVPKVINRATGEVRVEKSNQKSVDDGIEFIKTTNEYQELAAQDPVKAQEALEYLRTKYSSESQKGQFVSAVKPRATGSGNKTEPAVNKAIEDFNKDVVGVMNFDKTSMKKFISGNWGGIESMRRSTIKGKDYINVTFRHEEPTASNPQNVKTKPSIQISVPEKLYDSDTGEMTEEGKTFYQRMWELYPRSLQQGISNKPLSALMNPTLAGERQYMPDEPIQKEQVLESFKNVGEKSSNDQVEGLVATIKKTFGNDMPIEYTTGRGTFKANGITFNGKFYSRKTDGEKTIGRDLKKDIEIYLGLNLAEPEKKSGGVPKMFQ